MEPAIIKAEKKEDTSTEEGERKMGREKQFMENQE